MSSIIDRWIPLKERVKFYKILRKARKTAVIGAFDRLHIGDIA